MNYKDSLQSAGIPVMGMLAWYNVSSDASVSQKTFLTLRRLEKAPVAYIKPPKPANVFRRACESVQEKWEINDVTYDIFTKDLGYSLNFVKREIRATSGKQTLALGTLVFDKTKNETTLDMEYLASLNNPSGEAQAHKVYNQVCDFMEANKDTIHSLPIRESIRKAIECKLNGILVKPGGGVYFIPLRQYNGLNNLMEMMNSILGVTVHITPLIRDEVQQAMLTDALQDYVTGALFEIDTEINELANPTAKKLNDIKTELYKLKNKTDLYSNITQNDIGVIKLIEASEAKLQMFWEEP